VVRGAELVKIAQNEERAADILYVWRGYAA
jgi:hypothetical protein